MIAIDVSSHVVCHVKTWKTRTARAACVRILFPTISSVFLLVRQVKQSLPLSFVQPLTEQARGRVSQTAVKTPAETHIQNALYSCLRNTIKTQIIAAHSTCLNRKMLHKAYFRISKWDML